jgi:hypothetical protein
MTMTLVGLPVALGGGGGAGGGGGGAALAMANAAAAAQPAPGGMMGMSLGQGASASSAPHGLAVTPLSLVYSSFGAAPRPGASLPPPAPHPPPLLSARSVGTEGSGIIEINGPLSGIGNHNSSGTARRTGRGGAGGAQSAPEPSLPPGFFRVEDEAHAERLRAQIQAQDSLHDYLGGSSSAAASAAAAAAATQQLLVRFQGALASATGGGGGGPSSGLAVVSPTKLRPGAGASATGLQAAILQTAYAPGMLALPPEALGAGVRVTPAQRVAGIAYAAEARAAIRQAIELQAKVLHSMETTETALRYGMFLLALMYFRIMNQLARLKHAFGGDAEAQALLNPDGGGDKAAERSLGLLPTTASALTQERHRMVAAEKAKLKREAAKAVSNAKASSGYAAKAARAAAVAMADRMAKVRRERRRFRTTAAALKIQCAFRGFRVRRTIEDYKRRKKAHDEYAALRTYAATRIASVWRGYMGRILAAERRQELLDFIKFYRSNEAEEMLTEFYSQNPIKKYFKERDEKKGAREAAVVRAQVVQARLLKDEDARAQMGAAAPLARNTYGNIAKLDKHVEGKTAEELAAEALEEDEEERDRKAVAEAMGRDGGAGAAGTGLAGSSSSAAAAAAAAQNEGEEADGDVARPVDLDRLGVDPEFFNMRKPPPSYAPVGKDRLRGLLAKGYARNTARALKAETSGAFETGMVDESALRTILEENPSSSSSSSSRPGSGKTARSGGDPPAAAAAAAANGGRGRPAEPDADRIRAYERQSARRRLALERKEMEDDRERARRRGIRADAVEEESEEDDDDDDEDDEEGEEGGDDDGGHSGAGRSRTGSRTTAASGGAASASVRSGREGTTRTQASAQATASSLGRPPLPAKRR